MLRYARRQSVGMGTERKYNGTVAGTEHFTSAVNYYALFALCEIKQLKFIMNVVAVGQRSRTHNRFYSVKTQFIKSVHFAFSFRG